MAAMDEGGTL